MACPLLAKFRTKAGNSPAQPNEHGSSTAAGWVQHGRNMRHATSNLSAPKGREIFLSLIPLVDIWMESSIPGTYREWGLDDETGLKAIGASAQVIRMSILTISRHVGDDYKYDNESIHCNFLGLTPTELNQLEEEEVI